MKRILCLLAVAVGLSSCGVVSQLDAGRLLQGGVYAAQALTLTDAQVENYVHQYIQQLDAQSQVLSTSSSWMPRARCSRSPARTPNVFAKSLTALTA